jgi:hypothetical protein
MKKMKWDKDGPYRYSGLAKHAETNQWMVIYRDGTDIDRTGINLVAPFDPKGYSMKGMPRNRGFDLIED